jgi:beta-mannosidase
MHYAARRFYAPLMLSIEDKPPEQKVYVSNDGFESWEGTVNWSLEKLSGDQVISGSAPVRAPSQGSVLVEELDFSDQITDENLRQLVFIAELWQGDRFVSRRTAFFVPIKHLSLTDPAINVNMKSQDGNLIIELAADTLALLVEVSLEGADVVFSDNYFNLAAGRSVQITCPLPAGWTLSMAQEAVRVCSVYDSYSHPTAD